MTPFIGSTAQTPVTVTGNPPATSTTVTGLTNGTTYTFTVSASNANGAGPVSAPSNAVTPSAPAAPGAPTGVTATAGNASAAVSWTAPTNTGGSAITSYKVTPFIGSTAQTPVTVTGSPPATSTTVTGLTNGTTYTFTVSATNATGTGPESAQSNAVTPVAAPTVTSVTPSQGATNVAVSVAPTATFSQAVVPSTVSFTLKDSAGNAVAGSLSFGSGNTVATFTPASSLSSSVTYTATVSGAQNASGVAMTSPFSWSFTTAGAQCPCSIWQNGTPTGAVDDSDTSAVNLGLKFQANVSGFINAVRFYKESDNTGTHLGSLWSSTGTLLASGTFSNETASGWQELDFSTPVQVTAGTTYVASYHTNTGHYAITSNGLASAVTNGPLTALASGGVYAYGSGNAFPSSTFNASNYWVDVVYSQTAGATPPTVTTVTPSSGATGVPVSVAPTATFSQAVVPSTVSFTLKDSGGNTVPGSVSFNGANTVATFTPTTSLAASTGYTATVSGAQNSSGVAMSSPFSWSFTTGAVSQCPCSIWQNAAPSGAVDAADTSGVNLGMQFQASASGHITGIRFYKESDNTGTHIGSLWSSTGTLLATGTFSDETAVGLAGAGLLHPGGDHRGDDLRGLVLHQHGTLCDHLERAGVGGDQRAADRAGQRRRLRLRLGERLPVEQLQRVQLLGRRRVLDPLTGGTRGTEHELKRIFSCRGRRRRPRADRVQQQRRTRRGPRETRPCRSAALRSTRHGRTARGPGLSPPSMRSAWRARPGIPRCSRPR